MLLDYIQAAMRRAKYEILADGTGFYGHIPECHGVWANTDTLEACREELQEVLEDWILVRARHGLELPVLDGMDINVRQNQDQEVA